MSTLERNDLSELEREYELEMVGEEPAEREDDVAEELEEPDAMSEYEDDDVGSAEFEALRDESTEEDEAGDFDRSDYAQRFYELSLREFESEYELETAISRVIDDMEREYFFGGLMKKVSRAGKGLLKKGLKLAKHLPAVQAVKGITQLARGNLKGMLGNLAKAALGAAAGAIPGAGAVLPALQALGFKLPGGGALPSLDAFKNLVSVSRESFDHLARELTERADQPIEASRVAATAFQRALRGGAATTGGPRLSGGRRRRIRVRRGDVLVIEVV